MGGWGMGGRRRPMGGPGCCGCLFPVLGVAAMLAAALFLMIL